MTWERQDDSCRASQSHRGHGMVGVPTLAPNFPEGNLRLTIPLIGTRRRRGPIMIHSRRPAGPSLGWRVSGRPGAHRNPWWWQRFVGLCWCLVPSLYPMTLLAYPSGWSVSRERPFGHGQGGCGAQPLRKPLKPCVTNRPKGPETDGFGTWRPTTVSPRSVCSTKKKLEQPY